MTINIGWPEGIFLVLIMFSIAVRYANVGNPRPADKWWGPMLDLFVTVYLLYWGGFFS